MISQLWKWIAEFDVIWNKEVPNIFSEDQKHYRFARWGYIQGRKEKDACPHAPASLACQDTRFSKV